MNSYIQLICLIISFIYGYFLCIANEFNKLLIKDKNIILKFVISLLYLFNISLVYVVFLYYINSGVLHMYFILLILLGYGLCDVTKRKGKL